MSERCNSLREMISKNSQRYMKLWRLSSQNQADVERLDKLCSEIYNELHKIRHLWATLQETSDEHIPIDLRITYIRYLIELTPYSDEGQSLLQQSAQEIEDADPEQYQRLINFSNQNQILAETTTSELPSFKQDILNLRSEDQLPNSLKVLKIIGFAFLIVIVCMNSLEWHLAADRFSEHLNNMLKVSLANQLRTETQSLISYAQDLSFLQYRAFNDKTLTQDIYNDHHAAFNIGLQESIINASNITDILNSQFDSADIQMYMQTEIQAFTGMNLNQTTEQRISEVFYKSIAIAKELLTISQENKLSSFFSFYNESLAETSEKDDINKQKIQFVLMNLLNGVYEKQENLYQMQVTEFSDETSSMADTNGIMLAFVVLILVQIIGSIIWLVAKITNHRLKILKTILDIPFSLQVNMLGKCKDLLNERLDKVSADQEKKKDPLEYREFQGEDEEEEQPQGDQQSGKPQKEGLFDGSNLNSSSPGIKKLNNIFNKKVAAFSGILVLLLAIYFVSNFLVQKHLASDMQTYVKVEDAASISESFYMLTDNSLRMYLLNATIPVLYGDSLTVFKTNVMRMKDKEDKISTINSEIFNPALKKIFESIMIKNPCQIIADGSDKVTTKQECEQFGEGIVAKGLSSAMQTFVQLSERILTNSTLSQLSKTPAVVRLEVLTLPEVRLARQLQRIYIKEGLLVLKESLRQSMEKEMKYFLRWKEFSWYGGVIIIVITFLQLYFKIIRKLPEDIIRARKSLQIIPLNSL